MKTIKLHWWNGHPDHQHIEGTGWKNAGDELSPVIFSEVTHRPIEWAPMEEADYFSIGSICPRLADESTYPQIAKLLDKRKRPISVIGSGLPCPTMRLIHKKIDYYLVRGPLTAMGLSVPLGDPALLVSKLWPELKVSPHERYGVGIIPHHNAAAAGEDWIIKMAEKEASSGGRVIDPRDPPLEFVRQIASCKTVKSQSLHGLVIADAFNIPNYWLHNYRLHDDDGGVFKFYDYFASVGRPCGTEQSLFKMTRSALNHIQDVILKAFCAADVR